METELVDPRREPVPSQWSSFVARERLTPAWDHRALTALAWCSPHSVRLGLVRDGATPVGLFCGTLVSARPGGPVYSDPDRLPPVGVFACRLLAGFHTGFALAGGLDLAGRRAAVRSFERAVRRHCGARCLGIVYESVEAPELPLVAGRLRLRRAVAPNLVWHNRYRSMAEYFDSLPRRRRRRFTRVWEEVARDQRFAQLTGVSRVDPVQARTLDWLTRTKYARPGRVVPLPARYFEILNGSDGVRYFAHQRGEPARMEAFDLTFVDDRVMTATVTGQRQSAGAHELNLHLHLYLQEIAYAIQNGLSTVEFGKGKLDFKTRFGCVAVPQFAVAALR